MGEHLDVCSAPFLTRNAETRRVIYSTNAIELHAHLRRATRAKGYLPNGLAALKCLSMVVRSPDPTGRGRRRCRNRCKPALNAFAITFECHKECLCPLPIPFVALLPPRLWPFDVSH